MSRVPTCRLSPFHIFISWALRVVAYAKFGAACTDLRKREENAQFGSFFFIFRGKDFSCLMVPEAVRASLINKAKSTAKCLGVVAITGWIGIKTANHLIDQYLEVLHQNQDSENLYIPPIHILRTQPPSSIFRILSTFESSKVEAKRLIASFYEEINSSIKSQYKIEDLMAELQSPSIGQLSMEDGRATKLKIWNDIKIEGISNQNDVYKLVGSD